MSFKFISWHLCFSMKACDRGFPVQGACVVSSLVCLSDVMTSLTVGNTSHTEPWSLQDTDTTMVGWVYSLGDWMANVMFSFVSEPTVNIKWLQLIALLLFPLSSVSLVDLFLWVHSVSLITKNYFVKWLFIVLKFWWISSFLLCPHLHLSHNNLKMRGLFSLWLRTKERGILTH